MHTYLEIRIRAAGDDKSMWDVEVKSEYTPWKSASPELAKAILAHVETTDANAWEDIRAAA